MSDNLKELKENVDFTVPLSGGVASVKVLNDNPHRKQTIDKLGRYTGFPFLSSRSAIAGVVPNGSFIWNANAMNKSDVGFDVAMGKFTQDGNDIGRVLNLLSDGDLIHFKDFVGRSTTLKFIGFTNSMDAGDNPYYTVDVEGFAENTNYAYQVGEFEPSMVEFITNAGTGFVHIAGFEIITGQKQFNETAKLNGGFTTEWDNGYASFFESGFANRGAGFSITGNGVEIPTTESCFFQVSLEDIFLGSQHSQVGNTFASRLEIKPDGYGRLLTTHQDDGIIKTAKVETNIDSIIIEHSITGKANSSKLVVENESVNIQTNSSVGKSKLLTDDLTVDRTHNLPNKDGTIALSENTVNLTGNQTIAGIKDFTGSVKLNSSFFKDVTVDGHGYLELDEDTYNFVSSPSTPNDSFAYRVLSAGSGFLTIGKNQGDTLQLSASTILGGKLQSFINANGTIPVLRTVAPTSSTDTGVKGEIFADASYIYYCYDTNLWRRIAGSTF